jgi:hypothetical protein
MRDLQQRAEALGFSYLPVADILSKLSEEEIIERVAALGPIEGSSTAKIRRDAEALLGLAETPKVTISQALELYLSEIALDEQTGKGFPHFRDRGYLLSQSLPKAFKSRGLLPSKNHRIYSFRHSFEKRMLEGGLDYGLRCALMGHRNPRPEYGDGGSLTYRRDEMLKIVHLVSESLLNRFPFQT